MVKSRYKLMVTGISLVVLLLLGLGAYALRPLHFQKKVSVCTLDGDVLEAELDITLHRHLWKPVESHGTIMIEGVEYVNMNDLYSERSVKANGAHIFLIPASYALDSWENDKIYLSLMENNLDSLMLDFVRSGEMLTYFGPAESQAEVQSISEKWADPQ